MNHYSNSENSRSRKPINKNNCATAQFGLFRRVQINRVQRHEGKFISDFLRGVTGNQYHEIDYKGEYRKLFEDNWQGLRPYAHETDDDWALKHFMNRGDPYKSYKYTI